ncbi:MAG: hydrolase or metal-binding protein [Pseudomonadota bacterium]
MIKGLAITPPVLGRISIGRVVEKNGKRLPEKDDQFTITTQVQVAGAWVPHPYDEELRKNAPNGKLRSIPVRMLFNDPDLNLRAEYSMFDRQSGRPICVGNGETCRRVVSGNVQTLPCPSPDACELAKGGMCKPYGRLNVRIGDDDELGTFIFRTTGFNSIRTLAARLSYYKAVSGNLLACLPLELRLRGKSTTQSHRGAIYYVDLVVREGMTLESATTDAKRLASTRLEAGLDQTALDATGHAGFGNATFEYGEDEGQEIVEEFYSAAESEAQTNSTASTPSSHLRRRLEQLTTPAIEQPQV